MVSGLHTKMLYLCPWKMWDSTVPDRPDFWPQEVVFGNKNDSLYMSLRR